MTEFEIDNMLTTQLTNYEWMLLQEDEIDKVKFWNINKDTFLKMFYEIFSMFVAKMKLLICV